LVYADEEITNARVFLSTEIGLKVYTDKIKYIFMVRDQTARRIHSMKDDNSSIERTEKFKYMGTNLTNKILFKKKVYSVLKASFHL
jgi:hypothetical protein